MKKLISISDFKGSVRLPNVSAPINATIYSDLIDTYQKKALIDIFGYDFYLKMETAIGEGPIEEEEPIVVDQKWIDLVDGADMTINDKKYRYNGLKEILTHYIFYYWVVEYFPSINSNSITTPFAENSTVTDPNFHITIIWNRMINIIYEGNSTVYLFLNYVNDFPETEPTILEAQSWL